MDNTPPRRLCHVTTPDTMAAAGTALRGEPFLHCCTEAQLAFVLRRHFAGRTGLLVLSFDSEAIEGQIVWERSEPDQDPFPHLYGALPLAAATVVPT
jgi:uncharacterized protein (DUF952 family)